MADPSSVQPTFRRYWIKILPSGEALPQFDPLTGVEHQWQEYTGPLAQVLFLPMTPALAARIQAAGKNLAEASTLKALSFDVLPGEEVLYHRVGKVKWDTKQICGLCEAEFNLGLTECPRCLAKNQWYCSKCDELKHSPIAELILEDPLAEGVYKRFRIASHLALQPYSLGKILQELPYKWPMKGVQIRCPECEKVEQRGLNQIRCIAEFMSFRHFMSHDLTIGGVMHIIIDYKTSIQR